MKLLMLVLVAQIRFDWQAPIQLKIDNVDIPRVTVTEDSFLIRNEAEAVVHVLDKNGNLRHNLGSEGQITVPYRVSHMPGSGNIYVYDGAKRLFSIWQEEPAMCRHCSPR